MVPVLEDTPDVAVQCSGLFLRLGAPHAEIGLGALEEDVEAGVLVVLTLGDGEEEMKLLTGGSKPARGGRDCQ